MRKKRERPQSAHLGQKRNHGWEREFSTHGEATLDEVVVLCREQCCSQAGLWNSSGTESEKKGGTFLCVHKSALPGMLHRLSNLIVPVQGGNGVLCVSFQHTAKLLETLHICFIAFPEQMAPRTRFLHPGTPSNSEGVSARALLSHIQVQRVNAPQEFHARDWAAPETNSPSPLGAERCLADAY